MHFIIIKSYLFFMKKKMYFHEIITRDIYYSAEKRFSVTTHAETIVMKVDNITDTVHVDLYYQTALILLDVRGTAAINTCAIHFANEIY